jgi:hypothetical protein
MASYGRDTDTDEVQRSRGTDHEGEQNEKSSGYNAFFLFAIATERSVAKASIDPGRTSLPNSEDLRIMSTTKNKYTMDDISMLTIREP